jgi:hypothetical protein
MQCAWQRGKLDGHAVEREGTCRYAAFQWEILRLTTGSDAEQSKDGESEVMVASHRRRGRKKDRDPGR